MKHLTTSVLKQNRAQLIKALQEIRFDLLRGSLIEKHRRCGKTNCHCYEGQGHASYYLAVSMPKGAKPITVYVSLKFKDTVEQALENYQKTKRILEEISDINRELLIRKML